MSAVLREALPAIRPMREHDVSEVIEIERRAYDSPWSLGIFRDCLRVGYCCWVLETDRIEAYGVMQVGAGESHILNLCVRPEVHGQGFGRMLLLRLLDLARDHHADTALLEVRPTNIPALGLYHEVGFSEVGLRRDYYPGKNGKEDALILAKSLV